MFPILPRHTYEEFDAARPRFAVLPVGSFEQHGRHLPVTTDTMIAGVIAARLAQARGGLPLSPVTISCSHEHAGFFGSISIRAETLAAIVRDIANSLEEQGVRSLAIVNAHGGNHVLANIVQEMNRAGPRVLLLPSRHHWAAAVEEAGIEHTPHQDMHAGEIETSILLHAFPDCVRMDRARDVEATERPLLPVIGVKGYSEEGTIGFPSRASAEKGRRLLDALVRLAAAEVDAFLIGE